MHTQTRIFSRRARHGQPSASCLTVLTLLSGFTFGHLAQAQVVYRIVGEDGKVTFSDKAPLAASGKVTPTVNLMMPGQAEQVNLPLEVRQVTAKFPVTLYVSSNCAPCDSGRNLLSNRGVPFTEKTVTTAEDSDALQKLSGSSSLPFLTIGGQHISGYLASEWSQYLNAAGYPEQSKLPANYRRAPATPLVAPKRETTKAVAPSASPVIAAPEPKPGFNPNNPAGIQF